VILFQLHVEFGWQSDVHDLGGIHLDFVQFLKDKGIAHVAIDSDNENSTFKRFHPDTRFLDLDNRRELDGVFAASWLRLGRR